MKYVIESALARFDENPDWDDIADIIKKMEMSQGAFERRQTQSLRRFYQRTSIE